MNQVAASILILAASILAHTANSSTTDDGFGGILGLIAMGLGLWGGMSLLTASLRDRVDAVGEAPDTPGLATSARTALQGLVPSSQRTPAPLGQDYGLSAETSARVAAVTQRRHLDRGSRTEVRRGARPAA